MTFNIKEAGRIRGFLDPAEMKFLNRLAQKTVDQFQSDSILCEIGSFCGRSTVAIASALKEKGKGCLYAVDWHQGSLSMPGYGTENYRSTYDEFIGNLKRFGVEDKVKVIKGKSADSAGLVPGQIHFLWIDGAHEYEDVKADFDRYAGKIAAGGYLLFHDACWTAWTDPFDVIRKDVLNSDGYNLYAMIGNTMVFKKEKNRTAKAVKNILERLCVFVSGRGRGIPQKAVSFIGFRLTKIYTALFHNWKT